MLDEEEVKINEIKEFLSPSLQHLFFFSDLKRFYDARKGNIQQSLEMINQWEIWYYHTTLSAQTQTPRKILNEIEDPLEDLHQRLCPISHMGEDKEGHPIYWEKSGIISGRFQELIERMTVEDMLARHIRNSVNLLLLFLLLNVHLLFSNQLIHDSLTYLLTY